MSTVTDRYCIRCGKPEGKVAFRSDDALKCENCDVAVAEHRKQYHRQYHAARSRAISALIAKHRREFERLMNEEREKEPLLG